MITINTPIRFYDDIPDEVDVAIIGGGVIGICSALFIARKGLKVAVLEKGRIAAEQSSRNWGWIRQHGRDPAELPIMMEASRLWEEIDQEVKGRTAFSRCGIMYLARTETTLSKREKWLDTAREHGLDSIALSKADLDKLVAQTSTEKHPWIGATYTASDARAEPWQAVPAIAELAQSEGVLIRENCAVRALDIEAETIRGVITESASIKASQVVLAGGAWSSLFLRRHGIKIPQLAVRATVARTEPVKEIFSVSAADEQLAFRRRTDGGYSLALVDYLEHLVGPDSFRSLAKWLPSAKQSFHQTVLKPNLLNGFPDAWNTPRKWTEDEESPFERMRVLDPAPAKGKAQVMQERFAARFAEIGHPKIINAWAGMIDAMPDIIPIVDRVPSHENLIIATGMSGHGFGIGPAFGKIIAQLACTQASGYDLSRFRFSRFSDGSKLKLGPSI